MNAPVHYRRYWMTSVLGFSGGCVAMFRSPNSGTEFFNTINIAIASVSATLLGFIVTAMAILFTVQRTKLVRDLAKAGQFQKIVWEFRMTSVFMLAALVGAFLGLFLDTAYVRFGVSATIFFFSTAIGFMLAAGHHFFLIIKYVND